MGYKTPNIDQLAEAGAMFTDYYGEQSCTAGRSAFITGQSPFRVGMPGAKQGISDKDPTRAQLLKPHGYTSGQFGKNHLGDRKEFHHVTDGGDYAAFRYGPWQISFLPQASDGFDVWDREYVVHRAPRITNLRQDPFEHAVQPGGASWRYDEWIFRRTRAGHASHQHNET